MKKIICLVLSLMIALSLSCGVVAEEFDKPYLLYGNDPDESDIYETYGNEVFLMQNRELKNPLKLFTITLNHNATKNIYEACKTEDSLSKIINESYFPELEGFQIICSGLNPDYFPSSVDYFLNDDNSRLQIQIYLDDWSRDNFKRSIEALAPRADIDIESIKYISYDLEDVTFALKCIAGWSDYIYPNLSENDVELLRTMDWNCNEWIDLYDVAQVLRVIAGWDVYTH